MRTALTPTFLVAALLAAPVGAAAAPESEGFCKKGVEPIDCLVAVAETYLATCQQLAAAEFRLGEARHTVDCVKQGRANIEQLRPTAERSSRVTASEVRNYAADALAALSGIQPNAGEVNLTYAQRQATTAQNLRAKGERLKMH